MAAGASSSAFRRLAAPLAARPAWRDLGLGALLIFLCGILPVLATLVVPPTPSALVFNAAQPPTGVRLEQVYGGERNADGPFIWTKPQAAIVVDLPGDGPYEVSFVVQDSSLAPAPRTLAVALDGASAGVVPLSTAPQTYHFRHDAPRGDWQAARLPLRIDLTTAPLTAYDQVKEQLTVAIERVKEKQEDELVNNGSYGLLNSVHDTMKVKPRGGAPTPDDMDELIARVWKEPAFFLAHPRAIAAFGRECTRRGVPPPTVTLFGTPMLTWRGIPLVPSDKLHVSGKKTDILLMRTGEKKRGVVGLFQPGIPGEVSPSMSVRFMGINNVGAAQYLISLYCSSAVLVEDAIGCLEGVEVDRYHEYG